MKIKFFPHVVNIAKINEIDVPAPATVLQLMFLLSEKYGLEMKNILLTQDEKLHPDMIVLLNGRHIEYVNGVDSKLSDDDTVSFFSRIAGG
jgi:sulfur-carrier protein